MTTATVQTEVIHDEQATEEPDELSAFMKTAYETLYLPYRQEAENLTVETFADGAKELTRRLLEMGIIFHDLLPYCKGDLILESQLRNLHAVKEPQHSAPPGIKPTSNPIQTPLEVIAITDALRKLKIDNLKYLLNGYELHESTSTNSTLDDDNHPVCCQRQPDEKATERDP